MAYSHDNILKSAIKTFLGQHLDRTRPVLLAFSGGPDSVALLHLLLTYRQLHPFELHLAHVDHGWREESQKEAQELAEMASELNLPFHTTRLCFERLEGNLEAASRAERLAFFTTLSHRFLFQAVIFAHHANDQAETVLKYVFEGKSLPYLTAMRSVTSIRGLVIWRPLLDVKKEVILSWLEEKELKAIDDKTNRDTRFLRSRFRIKMLPFLREEFGKEIESSLCNLSAEALELCSYLDAQLSIQLKNIFQGPLGTYVDLTTDCPKFPLEIRYLIRKMCERENCFLSREVLNALVDFLNRNVADKRINVGRKVFYVDRRRLFIFSRELITLFSNDRVSLADTDYCGWRISVETVPYKESSQPSWIDVWKGEFRIHLPLGEYHLGPPEMKARHGDHSINKWWTNHKVPAFLRHVVPVVWEGDRIACEFLTGTKRFSLGQQEQSISVLLKKLNIESETTIVIHSGEK